MNRVFATAIAVMFVVGCAAPAPKLTLPVDVVKALNSVPAPETLSAPPSTDFASVSLNLIGASESECDSDALADKLIDWTCAAYPYGHQDFISKWERVAASDDMSSQATLESKSDWMFFNEGGAVDFYGKTYEAGGQKVLIAYDPSESGREIFIGIGLTILAIMDSASGVADTSFLPQSNTRLSVVAPQASARQTTSLDGEYNCSDFSNQREAIAFFKNNGFNGTYDPYGLDADGNGIPCESFTRTTKKPVASKSRCPSGKYWVRGYTRSSGTKVRGHCRKKR